jgi:hypothetical protein
MTWRHWSRSNAAELAALGHIFPPDEHPYPVQAVAIRWRTALAAAGIRVLLAGRGDRAVGLACIDKDRRTRNHVRQLQALGYTIT